MNRSHSTTHGAVAIPGDRPPTILEAALEGKRAPMLVLVVAVPLVSWLWIATLARDMYGPMTGASTWMMTTSWDVPHLSMLWAMWAVMMTGMMLPSAAPMLLLYGSLARRAARKATNAPSPSRQVYVLAAGYLTVWAVFSLGATGLQRLLTTRQVLSPMMETASPLAGAMLLLIAGVYQLTPFKLACQRGCQSPLGFLIGQWRPGWSGAFRMGLAHGLLCVGCCWALTLLLFVGGVMNLAVVAALTVFVAFEKLTPTGVRGARISGALLIGAAVWMLTR